MPFPDVPQAAIRSSATVAAARVLYLFMIVVSEGY
jgi:hypothetical protein